MKWSEEKHTNSSKQERIQENQENFARLQEKLSQKSINNQGYQLSGKKGK